jgi:hypothetical protein
MVEAATAAQQKDFAAGGSTINRSCYQALSDPSMNN